MAGYITNWDCPVCGAEIQKAYAVRDEDGVRVAIECECGEFAAFKYTKLEEMQIEE